MPNGEGRNTLDGETATITSEPAVRSAVSASVDSRPRAEGRARFETTRQGLIDAAGQGDREQLADLCRVYWYPVYAFIRSHAVGSDMALDVTQDLFAGLIRRNDFAKFDPARARFRTWLKTCARNQLWKCLQTARKERIVGPNAHVQLETPHAEDRYQAEPQGDQLAPDRLFDRCWAATVASRAAEQLRQYYASMGKADLFTQLEPTLVRSESDVCDADLCAVLGRSAVDVRQMRWRMKRKYRELVRAEVARTVLHGDVDEEIRQLLGALS